MFRVSMGETCLEMIEGCKRMISCFRLGLDPEIDVDSIRDLMYIVLSLQKPFTKAMPIW